MIFTERRSCTHRTPPPSLRLSRHVRNSVSQKIANQIFFSKFTGRAISNEKMACSEKGKLTPKTDFLKMNGLTNTSLLCLLCVGTVALIKKREY